jgi:N-acetylmuramate 1-kinase
MKKYLQMILRQKGISYNSIRKIQGEASTRAFFRVNQDKGAIIAMVYPQGAPEELQKITRLTDTYRAHSLQVPVVLDSDGQRVLLLQDLGVIMLQKAFSQSKQMGQKKEMLEKVAAILIALKGIPCNHTDAILDTHRMKWEMDFFVSHFANHFLLARKDEEALERFRGQLHSLVDTITPIDTFGHRDFHSRNMVVHKHEIYLVDFQDSLVAPPYYDLISFAFDSYLDLNTLRPFLFEQLQIRGMTINKEQMYLTALERNIKALGTFGFQIQQRGNLSYKKYIARTLRHITSNPLFGRFFEIQDFAI